LWALVFAGCGGDGNAVALNKRRRRLEAEGTFGTLNGDLFSTPSGLLGRSHTHVLSSPAIAPDGTIYVGAEDHFLYALNPNGTVKWKYETGNSLYASPVIGSDGTIYIGSEDRQFYAINPNGTLKWIVPTKTVFTSSAAIGADGTIYAAGTHKDLTLFVCPTTVGYCSVTKTTHVLRPNCLRRNMRPEMLYN
jgi:outer membrane protein assembly factor BamB